MIIIIIIQLRVLVTSFNLIFFKHFFLLEYAKKKKNYVNAEIK
jgi:hypothetical protein